MTANPDPDQLLDDADQQQLLAVARRTLEAHLAREPRPLFDAPGAALLEPAGAFVTLRRSGELRGCIGTFEAEQPLIDTVQRMAVAAASSDPRFERVQAHELDQLTLEISVLSPLREATADEVQVGRHGVYVTRGMRRGVLLPQVATEQGWDRETFLDHTCLKAGLPATAWRDDDVRIDLFTAEVLSEE